MRTTSLWILVSLLVALGCDDGNGGADGGPADGGPTGGDACVTCPTDSGPTPDGGPDGNSFARAIPLTLGTMQRGVINPAGDRDYYRFEGTAGQWIQIITDANNDDDPAMVDTVITLYDASMTQIAENDDALPRANTDSEIITRLPAAGTYYVLVQEYSTWADDTARGSATFTYDLTVGQLDPAAAVVNVDAESGNDAASAQALTAATGEGGAFSLVVGMFDAAADVDVYSFTIPAGAGANYSVNLMPSGSDGNGSTATPDAVWVTNAEGTEIIARIDPSASTEAAPEIAPALAAGNYLLWIAQGGTPGANDFYVLKAFRTGDNPAETMEETNNLAVTPEPLTFNPSTAGRSAFVLAQLGEDDVDHFGITTMGTERVSIACGSRSLGSGVLGLTVTLLDATGVTEITSATEGADGILISMQAVPSAGDYLVRLTKTGQDPEVTGTWVRCGVHLITP